MHPKHEVGFNRLSPCVGDQLQSDSDLWGGGLSLSGSGCEVGSHPLCSLRLHLASQPWLGQCISLGLSSLHKICEYSRAGDNSP